MRTDSCDLHTNTIHLNQPRGEWIIPHILHPESLWYLRNSLSPPSVSFGWAKLTKLSEFIFSNFDAKMAHATTIEQRLPWNTSTYQLGRTKLLNLSLLMWSLVGSGTILRSFVTSLAPRTVPLHSGLFWLGKLFYTKHIDVNSLA